MTRLDLIPSPYLDGPNIIDRGIDVTIEEVIRMIEDLHVIFENNEMHTNAPNKDRVTLAEFKYMAKLYYENSSDSNKDKVNDLWAKILKTDLTLQKGVGAALTLKKNFEEKQKLRELQDVPSSSHHNHHRKDVHNHTNPHHMTTLKEKLSESKSNSHLKRHHNTTSTRENGEDSDDAQQQREGRHRRKIITQWESDRKDAIERCVFGTAFLFSVALFRARFFKV